MISRSLRVFTNTLVAGCCLTIATVNAQGDSPTPLDERIRGANDVVVATVQNVTPSWRENAHGDRVIVSRVQLQVGETLKGNPSNVAWVDVEGGTVDGITLHVSSLPDLKP